ncbi:hypothetical protein C8N35_102119 [Breoghania corrubedonensis]|uniref:Homeodomain-like domain-containing protein n=1 Tax=Breoghania corrubedonensis TaxID=665038 RepID=A0A2T5VCD3_9HYPH|nr:hypothetical protein [Breoghania corrubedonensis]PTW61410.1 hypothetical protein C8N35_102119 [Breoghania corrubedonensis]
MTDLPRPPAHIAPYVEALGHQRAAEFLLAFGGAAAYVAENPQERGKMTEAIGEDSVRALGAVLGFGRIDRVPVAGWWVAQVLYCRGASISQIARELRTSDKTVRKWLGEMRNSQRQLKLFAD